MRRREVCQVAWYVQSALTLYRAVPSTSETASPALMKAKAVGLMHGAPRESAQPQGKSKGKPMPPAGRPLLFLRLPAGVVASPSGGTGMGAIAHCSIVSQRRSPESAAGACALPKRDSI